MRPEVNSHRFEISLRGKIHFGVRQLHYQRLHDFRRSESHFGANFSSVNLTEVKFQSAVSFPSKQYMPAAKLNCAESLKLLISADVLCYYCLKNNQKHNICFALIKLALIKSYH